MKNRYIALSFALSVVLSGAIAYAAATGDTLKIPVSIGQGVAVTQKLIFNLGLGGSNPVIQSTAGGVVQLSNNGTNFVSAPTASDTMCVLAATQSLTNKDLTDLTNAYRAASGSQDGAVSTGAQTFAGEKSFTSVINAVGGFEFQSAGYATPSAPGLVSTTTQTFGGAKTFNQPTTMNSGTLNGTYGGSPTFSGGPSLASPTLTGVATISAGTVNFGVSTTTNMPNGLNVALLNVNSGGNFKVKNFSGSLGAGASTTLSISGTVLAYFGRSGCSACGSGFEFMTGVALPSSSGNSIFFDSSTGSSSSIGITSANSSGTDTYTVEVFYQ